MLETVGYIFKEAADRNHTLECCHEPVVKDHKSMMAWAGFDQIGRLKSAVRNEDYTPKRSQLNRAFNFTNTSPLYEGDQLVGIKCDFCGREEYKDEPLTVE